jgi:hypothetical protein
MPEYNQGRYHNAAARVDSGLEAWELYASMDKNNMNIVAEAQLVFTEAGSWVADIPFWPPLMGWDRIRLCRCRLSPLMRGSLRRTRARSRICFMLYEVQVSQSKPPPKVDSYFECRNIRYRVIGHRQGVPASRRSRVNRHLCGRERNSSQRCK